MKSLIFILSTFSLCVGCTGKSSKTIDKQTQVDEKYAEGKAIYDRSCISCHQVDGKGMEGVFPPLAGSDYLFEDKRRAAYQVLHGIKGEITVNGTAYNGIMPAQELSPEEVKSVLNYVLNSWGNDGGDISIEEVKNQAKET